MGRIDGYKSGTQEYSLANLTTEFLNTLAQVLTALQRLITSEKLYDPQNPAVILCDQHLEEALDIKALHVSEIRFVMVLELP